MFEIEDTINDTLHPRSGLRDCIEDEERAKLKGFLKKLDEIVFDALEFSGANGAIDSLDVEVWKVLDRIHERDFNKAQETNNETTILP